MESPDALRAVWRKRQGRWFTKGYEAAVAAIKDRTDDPSNPYYFGAAFNGSAFMTKDGPLLNDEFSEVTPEDARAIAFEMLALADLAEIAPMPS